MQCPFCGKYNQPGAAVCQYCEHALPAPAAVLCRVCGVTLYSAGRCPRCGVPSGMVVDMRDSTAATLIPADTAQAQVSKDLKTEERTTPQALRSWNRGAAYSSLYWCAAHGIWIYPLLTWALAAADFLLGLLWLSNPGWLPGLIWYALGLAGTLAFTIARCIWLGKNGGRLAWISRRYRSLEEALAAQKIWSDKAWAGALLTLLQCAALLVTLICALTQMPAH